MPEVRETDKLVATADKRVRPQTADSDSLVDEKTDEPGNPAQSASTDAGAKKWIGLAIAAVTVIVIAVVVFFACGKSGLADDHASIGTVDASAANEGADANTSFDTSANANANASQTATSSGGSRLTKEAGSSEKTDAANNAPSTDVPNGNGEVITYTYETATNDGSSTRSSTNSDSAQGSSGEESGSGTGTDHDDGALRVYVTVDCSRAPGYESVMFEDWVKLSEGATAYDALVATGLTVGGNSTYVSSIGGLAEKFPGYEGGSGWMYKVNGTTPNVSCGKCTLSENDTLVWAYTLDMGNDL